MEEKTCSKCGQAKPATTRYFYQHKRGASLLRSQCKECTSKGPRKRSSLDDIANRYSISDNGCWMYTKGIDALGYGVFYYQQIGYKAHRVSYEFHKGKIPKGLVLDHTCRNRACINPDHLDPVTQSENARRVHLAPHCSSCTCEKE